MTDTWYKTEYPYRKKITLTNTAAEVADDSYLIEVDTAAMVSAGKCRSDCDDIIFCRADDPAELTRYILPGSENTAATSIYVRIIPLAAGDTDIYMYYGSGLAAGSQSLVEYYKELKGSVDVSGLSGYYRDIYRAVNETPDGIITEFTVEDGAYLADSLAVYLNGQQLKKDLDFEETDPAAGTFTFLLVAPVATDEIWVEYYDESATPFEPATPYWSEFTADTGSISADQQGDSFFFHGTEGISTEITGGKQVLIGVKEDGIKTTHIDWGTATPEIQVSAEDIPIEDSGGYFSVDNIEAALQEIGSGAVGGGGAWETLYDYVVTGDPVSRYLMTVNEATHSSFALKVMVYNGHGSSTAENYLYYNEDETDGHYYRQKYYYTNTTLSASQDNNPFIGGVLASDTGVINANIYRPTGAYVVFTESTNMAKYNAGIQYPRAYIGMGRYVGAAALTKICLVCKTGGVETALLYAGTRITLLGLKV